MPSKPAVLEPTEAVVDETPTPTVEAPDPPAPDPALDDQDDEEEQGPDAPSSPSAEASGLDVLGLMNQFAALMNQREEQIWAKIEARLAAIVPPVANGHAPEADAEMDGPHGGHPTWMTMPQIEGAPPLGGPVKPPPRMVAFIPRIDPFNPRMKTFRCWLNGREMRAKRGQVMILTLSHGIRLAKLGHGNCVDIAAMQGSLGTPQMMDLPGPPDLSRPDDWDGRPMTNSSSFRVGR